MMADEELAPLHSAETVALAYKALGLLDTSAPSQEVYTVRDFVNDPPLREGYSLQARILLKPIVDEHKMASRIASTLFQSSLANKPWFRANAAQKV